MEVSLNYCSQNGENSYEAPYCNRNLNIGPRVDSNLGHSPYNPCTYFLIHYSPPVSLRSIVWDFAQRLGR